MEYNIDILKILGEVFGTEYLLSSEVEQDDKIVYPDGFRGMNEDDPAERSVFGTPIFDVIEFKSGGVVTLVLKDAPLVTITRAKNIVRTQVQGRDGTIKEIISNDDYKINVKGLLVNTDSNKRPIDQLEQLNNLLNSNTTHKVSSRLLSKLGITDLVVTDFEFPSYEGYVNVIPYSFNALSDDPAELKL